MLLSLLRVVVMQVDDEERAVLLEMRKEEGAAAGVAAHKKNYKRKQRGSALSAGRTLSPVDRSDLVDMFYYIDADRGGAIGQAEADSFIPIEMLKTKLVKWDTDDDDKINLSEWLNGWENLMKTKKGKAQGEEWRIECRKLIDKQRTE